MADGLALIMVKPNCFKKQRFSSSILPKIQVKNDPGVLNRLVSCLKCMKLACKVLHGHLEPVYLLRVSKIDEEKYCFLK